MWWQADGMLVTMTEGTRVETAIARYCECKQCAEVYFRLLPTDGVLR